MAANEAAHDTLYLHYTPLQKGRSMRNRAMNLRLLIAVFLSVVCMAGLSDVAWASEALDITADALVACDTPLEETAFEADGQVSYDSAESPSPGTSEPDPSLSAATQGATDVQVDAAQSISEPRADTTDEPSPVEVAPQAEATFAYEHDPRDNPRAMADIDYNSQAVYGFQPSTSGSIKQYANYDWTDSAVVEGARRQRITYHEGFAELYELLDQMQEAGATTEQMARAISTKRNELRMKVAFNDPAELARLKARNLEQYGNENGGTPEYFFERYGSWETVLEKSFSVNSGMDACVGLYDTYYSLYVAAGQVPPDSRKPAAEEVTTNDVAKAPCEAATVEAPREEAATATPAALSSAPLRVLPATGDATVVMLPVALLACGTLVLVAAKKCA